MVVLQLSRDAPVVMVVLQLSQDVLVVLVVLEREREREREYCVCVLNALFPMKEQINHLEDVKEGNKEE